MPHPVSVARRDRVETMSVPGATMSGLMRPSLQGPRLENAARPCTLLLIGRDA
jgi:hypothetical protein